MPGIGGERLGEQGGGDLARRVHAHAVDGERGGIDDRRRQRRVGRPPPAATKQGGEEAARRGHRRIVSLASAIRRRPAGFGAGTGTSVAIRRGASRLVPGLRAGGGASATRTECGRGFRRGFGGGEAGLRTGTGIVAGQGDRRGAAANWLARQRASASRRQHRPGMNGTHAAGGCRGELFPVSKTGWRAVWAAEDGGDDDRRETRLYEAARAPDRRRRTAAAHEASTTGGAAASRPVRARGRIDGSFDGRRSLGAEAISVSGLRQAPEPRQTGLA